MGGDYVGYGDLWGLVLPSEATLHHWYVWTASKLAGLLSNPI